MGYKMLSYCETKEPIDKYVFCDGCSDFVYEYCSIHGTLLIIPDAKVPLESGMPSYVPRAALTIPRVFLHLAPSSIPGAGLGVFTSLSLPRGVRFGPYHGRRTNDRNREYAWQINGNKAHLIDASDANASNWMRYVNCARHWCEQNLLAYQYQGDIYYRTIKTIPQFTELMVFYGSEAASLLRIDLKHYNSPPSILQETCVPQIFSNVAKADIRLQEIQTIEQNILTENYDNINYMKTCSISKNPPDITEKNNETNTRNLQIYAQDVNDNDRHSENVKTKNLDINDIGDNINDEIKLRDRFICDTCGRDFLCKDVLINHIEDHTSKTNSNTLEIGNTLGNLQIIKNKDALPKLFECSYCDYKNFHEYNFKRHISIHTGERPFKCTVCNYSSIRNSDLKRHIRTHTGERPYQCTYCNYSSTNNSHLKTHIRTHTGERPYKCTYCNYSFINTSDLKRHIRTHTGERPYKCTYCNNSFTQNGDLKVHIRTHTGERLFKCTYCNHSSNTNTDLKRHIRTHTGERPYKCTYCNNSFTQNGDLKIHIRTHTGERPYKCTYCNYSSIKNSRLKTHIRTHTGERPYKCTYCNHSSNTNTDLKTHIRIHTGEKPYKCTYCNHSSNTNTDLKTHIRTHTREKPYKCTYCNHSSNTNTDLKRHIRTHTGERPYKCTYCNHSSNTNTDLKRHIRTHTGERPYKCTYCNYSSIKNSHLKNHIRKHTGERIHTGERLQCAHCSQNFTRKSNLIIHLRKHN